jgi:SSS family transporter
LFLFGNDFSKDFKMLELKSVNTVDYLIIIAYLVLVAFIGIYLSRLNRNTADYFKGNGQLPWWMAGLSTFISGFSAFVFVAAAGFTYKNGMAGLTIFTSAFWAYWLGYFFYGVRWRRARLSSPMEFLTRRYSAGTTYYYTLLSVVPSIMGLGISIYILSIFISTAIGLGTTEIEFLSMKFSGFEILSMVIGFITVAYTAFGGLWAVVITDVIQFLILILMSLAIFPLAFQRLGGDAGIWGGVTKLLHESPPGYFNLHTADQTAGFFIAYILMVLFNYNGQWHVAQRYYSVPDERDTKKMALLCSVLSLVGPIIWIIPAMISRHIFPDIAAYWPNLAEPTEASFVSLAMYILPHGMIGLVVAGILAATMSSSDSAFNYLSAVITKDVYLPLTEKFTGKTPGEDQQLRVGRLTILIIGVLSIWVALFVPRFGGAFNFGLQFSSLFAPALILPVVIGLIYLRTPWWSAIASSAVSIILVVGLNLFALARHGEMYNYQFNIFTGIVSMLVVFFGASFFKNKNRSDQERLEKLKADLQTPALADGNTQFPPQVILAYRTVGFSSIVMGVILFSIGLFQSILSERLVNFVCGAAAFFVGLGLLYFTFKNHKKQVSAGI